jgi:hypothetical protein
MNAQTIAAALATIIGLAVAAYAFGWGYLQVWESGRKN